MRFLVSFAGIWLLELSRGLSESASLYGVDLSTDRFPKDVPNVQYSVASVTDLPQKWTGQFDFVDQRLLVAGLLARDWPIALENHMHVLKASGHIQLVEPDSSTFVNGPYTKGLKKNSQAG